MRCSATEDARAESCVSCRWEWSDHESAGSSKMSHLDFIFTESSLDLSGLALHEKTNAFMLLSEDPEE